MSEFVILRDSKGREVVQFTTPCGITAVVATSISQAALAKFSKSLKRKMARMRRKALNSKPY